MCLWEIVDEAYAEKSKDDIIIGKEKQDCKADESHLRGQTMITGAFMVPHPPLIIPEIGRGEEKKIQNTIDAYHEIGGRIGALKPDTIVLISPHQIMYADYFHISPGRGAKGDFGQDR